MMNEDQFKAVKLEIEAHIENAIIAASSVFGGGPFPVTAGYFELIDSIKLFMDRLDQSRLSMKTVAYFPRNFEPITEDQKIAVKKEFMRTYAGFAGISDEG